MTCEGNFAGVKYGDRFYTVEEWNEPFEGLDPTESVDQPDPDTKAKQE